MLTVDYELLGVEPAQLVLDLGSGGGRHAFESIRRGCAVVAVDTDREELQRVAEGIGLLRSDGAVNGETAAEAAAGDATGLPFADATFDAVIAAEVLEHVPNDRAAIAELVRVLRPGGRMAVSVPAQLAERVCWWLSADYHAPAVVGGHVRIYSRSLLTHRLERAGLRVEAHHGAHGFHAPYWWLRCLFGPNSEPNAVVRAYHRFLVRDMTTRGRFQAFASTLADRVLPKSLVVYATKPSNDAAVFGGWARDRANGELPGDELTARVGI